MELEKKHYHSHPKPLSKEESRQALYRLIDELMEKKVKHEELEHISTPEHEESDIHYYSARYSLNHPHDEPYSHIEHYHQHKKGTYMILNTIHYTNALVNTLCSINNASPEAVVIKVSLRYPNSKR